VETEVPLYPAHVEEGRPAEAPPSLNRKDWGLGWNQILEAGRLLVGDEIKIEIETALIRKVAAPAAAAS
jgi:hypothetical protein